MFNIMFNMREIQWGGKSTRLAGVAARTQQMSDLPSLKSGYEEWVQIQILIPPLPPWVKCCLWLTTSRGPGDPDGQSSHTGYPLSGSPLSLEPPVAQGRLGLDGNVRG